MAYDIYNDPSMTPGPQGIKISAQIAQRGITPMLTKTYTQKEASDLSFYSGVGQELATNDIPIGFGRVMIRGKIVDKGVLRSDFDPSKIKKVYQFVTTDGQAKGIVGVADDKLKNIKVGGKTVTTTTNQKNQSVGLKEIATGLATSAAIMAGTSYVKELFTKDPKSGLDMPTFNKPLIGSNTPSAKDVLGTGAKNQVYAWNDSTKKGEWKHFVQAFKDSGIDVNDVEVWHNGSVVNNDVLKFNFLGDNWTVTDAGNHQVNVSVIAPAGSTGGGGGGSTGGGTTSGTCVTHVQIPYDPKIGAKFVLKRNGMIMSVLAIDRTNIDEIATREVVAKKLASDPNIPKAYNSVNFTIAADGTQLSITGDDSCRPCDIGTWEITSYTPSRYPSFVPCQRAATNSDKCAPQAPSTTKIC